MSETVEKEKKVKPKNNLKKVNKLVDDMPVSDLKKLHKELGSKINSEEQIVSLNYNLKCYANEGAVAFYKAVEEIHGVLDLRSSAGASGDNPPDILTVNLPDGTTFDVPWGNVYLPHFEEDEYLEIGYNNSSGVFYIQGDVRRKDKEKIDVIVKRTQEILDTQSIYKGRAITIDFPNNRYEEPTFLSFDNIDEKSIIMSDEVYDGMIPILSRIENTENCVQEGIDLKYGALMEGPYGTGKTLLGFWLGKIAIAHGWTFIYSKNCHNTEKALRVAENYTRCGKKGVVLFTEDIDQSVKGKRDTAMQGILNTLDGGDTKKLPIISIFTTNHIEVIDPTFLRGKRIGGLISPGPLDVKTAKKFLNTFVVDNEGKPQIDESELDVAAKALEGIVPAYASEVVDRAKTFKLHRKANKISAEDISKAAASYKRQIELSKLKVKSSPMEEIGQDFQGLFDPMIKKSIKEELVNGDFLEKLRQIVREES